MEITKVRKELGVKQWELAKAIGMSDRNWARIESGELDIKLKDAWQLWAFLISKGMDENTNLINLFK